MSSIAVFLVLGGATAFAAKKIGSNEIKSNAITTGKIKKNAVTTAKIKKQAVTAAKVKKGTLTGTQINASTLGTVPTAQTANALAPSEGWHEVGAPGEPGFLNGWHNLPAPFESTAFYKDHEGIVHLQGFVNVGSGEEPIVGLVFTLPVGFRPGTGLSLVFPNVEENEEISVLGSNVSSGGKDLSGDIFANQGPGAIVSLNGITFRAEG
jgi:hypothetical protein